MSGTDPSHDSLSVSTRTQAKSQSDKPGSGEDSVKSPLPIRLPTKCKPKTDSDSDSDSKSSKSSASSTSKVSKVFKKTFKGKAIAIVKPFSNAVTEKKSPLNEKQKELEERLNLYEFGSDEERENSQGKKLDEESDENNLNKEAVEEPCDVSLSKSSAISSIKGIKRIKSGKQGSLSARRVKSGPELKSVRVRVEKLRNSPVKSDKNTVKQQAEQETESVVHSELETSSQKESSSSCSQSEASEESCGNSSAQDSNNQKSLEKVFSESDVATADTEPKVECKVEKISGESLGDSHETAEEETDQHLLQLKNDKIIDIVKSELFSEPLPIKKEPVKLEKSELERNEDRNR